MPSDTCYSFSFVTVFGQNVECYCVVNTQRKFTKAQLSCPTSKAREKRPEDELEVAMSGVFLGVLGQCISVTYWPREVMNLESRQSHNLAGL